MFNSKKYYFIPLSKITDKMISDANQTSKETLRESVRPVDGKIHGIITFTGSKPVPEYMKPFKQYSHEEILSVIQSPEWNLTQPIQDLIGKYDFESLIKTFESDNIIQSFGEAYITIFQILKFNFFLHSKEFIDGEDKWKLFKGNRFEKANEFTLLELNYFYNLITKDEKEKINDFRDMRNAVSHSFDQKHSTDDLRNSLIEINVIITKYLTELEV